MDQRENLKGHPGTCLMGVGGSTYQDTGGAPDGWMFSLREASHGTTRNLRSTLGVMRTPELGRKALRNPWKPGEVAIQVNWTQSTGTCLPNLLPCLLPYYRPLLWSRLNARGGRRGGRRRVGRAVRRASPKSIWGRDQYQGLDQYEGLSGLRTEDSVRNLKGPRSHYLREVAEKHEKLPPHSRLGERGTKISLVSLTPPPTGRSAGLRAPTPTTNGNYLGGGGGYNWLCFPTCVFLSFPNFSTGDLNYFCNWKTAFFIL